MEAFEAVKQSFARCGESDGFYDTFYEVFLAKSPEIPLLFAQTDFKKQKQLLKATITIMVRHRVQEEKSRTVLEKVGHTHRRAGHNIRPALYALWLESLCETVRRHDPDFSPTLEEQWRQRMQEGIAVITAMY